MKKSDALKIVNPILAASFLLQFATGIFRYHLPHEVFEIFHESGGYFLTACVVTHVFLNWPWVKMTFFGKKGKKPAKKMT